MATHFMQHDDDAFQLTDIPEELPILPLRNTVVYPFLVLPLTLTEPRSIALIEAALHGDGLIGLVAMKDSTVEEQMPDQLFETGHLGDVMRESAQLAHSYVRSKAVEFWVLIRTYSNGQTFTCTFRRVRFQKTVRRPAWRWSWPSPVC